MKRNNVISIQKDGWVDLDRGSPGRRATLKVVNVEQLELLKDCPPFMTTKHVATLLLVSNNAVHLWIQQGRLDSTLVGRLRRIHRTQLAKFLIEGNQ